MTRSAYERIGGLFDKGILKYNPNNPYYIFPYNLDVYNLFILNGYPINYQDSTVLYNFANYPNFQHNFSVNKNNFV